MRSYLQEIYQPKLLLVLFLEVLTKLPKKILAQFIYLIDIVQEPQNAKYLRIFGIVYRF